jgi:hypothetical protein
VLSASIAVLLLPSVLGGLAAITIRSVVLWTILLALLLITIVAFAVEQWGLPIRDTDTDSEMPAVLFLNAGILVVFVGGLLIGQLGVVAGVDDLVRQDQRTAPQVAFEFDYTETDAGGLLTIRHAGGESVRRNSLVIRGEGFASHPHGNLSEPGVWQGGTIRGADGEPRVVSGNTTTVGVTVDCDIMVVYENDGYVTAIGNYECQRRTPS